MSLSPLAEHSIKECQSSTNLTDKNNSMENDNFDRVMLQMDIADQSVFKKELVLQWKQAAIQQELISVLSCEIDFYNEYVKNYSVQGASFMLISVALTLKNICDLYGCLLTRNDSQGFNILIKGGTESTVLGIADSLCEAVKESQTEHKYSKIDNVITLSMGVSALYPQTMEIFKGQVKTALHNANVSGGNQYNNDTQPSADHVIKDDSLNDAKVIPERLATQTEDNDVLLKESIQISGKNAPISSESAPNKDEAKGLLKSEKANIKQKPVRMYRGQIIND